MFVHLSIECVCDGEFLMIFLWFSLSLSLSLCLAFLPIIVTHAITFLVGVIGNSVVIATWSVKGKLKSPTAMFLVSLAVADLLLLIVYVPLETLEYFVITWDRGGSICKLSSYVEMLSGMASVLNLVAVSFERYEFILITISLH